MNTTSSIRVVLFVKFIRDGGRPRRCSFVNRLVSYNIGSDLTLEEKDDMKYTLKEIIKSDEINEYKLLGFNVKAKVDTYILDSGFYEIQVPLISRRTNRFTKLVILKINENLFAEYLKTAEFPLITLTYTYAEFVNDVIAGYKKYAREQKKLNRKRKKEGLTC